MRLNHAFALSAAVALALLVVLASPGLAAPSTTLQVDVTASSFSPREGVVLKGGKVTFHDADGQTHVMDAQDNPESWSPITLTSNTPNGETPALNTAKTIQYRCTVHNDQSGTGTIIVTSAPTAAITDPPLGGSVAGTFTITGTAADPDGDTQVGTVAVTLDGTALSVTGTTSWSATATASTTHDAEHTIVVTVTDTHGATGTASRTVRVNAAPSPAFTLAPAQPTTAQTVQFNDTSTDDHLLTAWSWDFGDGNTSSQRNATHRFATKGPHTVTLRVTDDHGLNASLPQTVTVLNAPATVGFTVSPAAPAPNETVAFTSTSTDPDGGVLNWTWQFGDNATAYGANVTHAYAAPGDYSVNLTVRDTDDAAASLVRVVHVGTLASARPQLNLTANVTTGRAPLAVAFNLTGADPDGSLVNWTIDYGDGSAPESGLGLSLEGGVEATHVFALAGNFTVTLRALDDTGVEGTNSTVVRATAPPNAPDARFVLSPAPPLRVGQVARFTDNSSDADPGDAPTRWDWDLGDGTRNCCQNRTVDHRYNRTGKFLVTLAVTDRFGVVGRRTLEVAVGEAPEVLFAANRTSGRASLLVNFTLEARDDGRIVRWSVDFGDALRESGTGPPPAGVLHVYDRAGTYAARFTVTDDDDNVVESDPVRITVEERSAGPVPLPPSALVAAPTSQPLTYLFTAAAGLGGNVTYQWDFGDGQRAVGREVQHPYDAPGTYTVTLTLVGAEGPVARGTMTLEVTEEAAVPGRGRLQGEVASGVVRLSWQGDARAAGYQVWRAAEGGRAEELGVVNSGTTYTDLAVRDGALYAYTVTFFDPSGQGRLRALSALNNTEAYRRIGSVEVTALVDSDGDGVGDTRDASPNDPSKSEAGAPGPAALLAAGAGALAARALRCRRH